MLQRIVTVAIIAGLGYWYWTGPYRERTNPTYGETLQQNARAMEECIVLRMHYLAAIYVDGLTGNVFGLLGCQEDRRRPALPWSRSHLVHHCLPGCL